MKGMDAPSWEPALSFHLPKNPGVELLDRASEEVLIYLDWVSHDVASAGDADQIRKEITRAAARLIEIPLHWSPIPIRRGNHPVGDGAWACFRGATESSGGPIAVRT